MEANLSDIYFVLYETKEDSKASTSNLQLGPSLGNLSDIYFVLYETKEDSRASTSNLQLGPSLGNAANFIKSRIHCLTVVYCNDA